jgi:hypothetical protein
MSDADAVTVSIEVAVTPATAFEVFTEDLDAWWQRGPRYRFLAPHEGVLRLEPGVGGRLLHARDDAGDDVFEVGRVRVWTRRTGSCSPGVCRTSPLTRRPRSRSASRSSATAPA